MNSNENILVPEVIQYSNSIYQFTDDKGKIGIKNIGSTCYLGSALQCIFHTNEIAQYFLTDMYKKDKNIESDFVDSFASILIQKWTSASNQLLDPTDLKSLIVKRFIEYDKGQQDSHEILTIILDLLHQQLNRAINNTDSLDIKLHKTLSQTCLEIERQQNDSMIIDTFFGQLKSSTTCLNCYTSSCKYDPFATLELSIPLEYKIMIYFIPIKSNFKAMKLFVKINDNMQFKKIIDEVKNKIDYNFINGIFYTVLNNSLINLIDIDERCGDLLNRNFFLFLIESKNDVPMMEVDDEVNSHVKFYVCLHFLMFEENIKGRTASYPRLFNFNSSYLSNGNFIEVFNYLEEYSNQYIIKTDYDINVNTCYFNVKSRKNSDNLHYCLMCNKIKEIEFDCDCIIEILKYKDKQISLNKNDINEDFILEINININSNFLKFKELNRCVDLSNKHRNTESQINLYNLIDYYTNDEKLSNCYYCEKCGKYVKAIKKLEINKFPQILIINLKRFRCDQLTQKSRTSRNNSHNVLNTVSEKNDTLIHFEINNLDLSKYAKNMDTRYELYAVCYHDGRNGSLESGHYYSVCKHATKWIEYNDKLVKEYTRDIVNKDAYMLFYRKKL